MKKSVMAHSHFHDHCLFWKKHAMVFLYKKRIVNHLLTNSKTVDTNG